MEARARQASCNEEQCVYLEYCPDYQSYQYLKTIERVVGGLRNVVQFAKVNEHYLVGLDNKSLAEHLIREGLEIEGTLIRTFPFRKSSTRITVGNLPFFVGDAAIVDALSRYGRITSITPKLLRAGEFTYTDSRREAFILLHDGITIDKLPTRFEIRIKGEAWPAFLSHGIKCSKCHGQGHRRANCPQLHGNSTTSRRASPPSTTNLLPSTAPGLSRQSSAAPPAPAPPSSAVGLSGAPPDARAASLPSTAPLPSTPAPPASSVILGQTSLGYEELSTVMCDVKSLLNTRPLTYLTEESEDLVPLTPSLFLHEVREVGVPDLDLIDNQTLSRKYQYLKRVREDLRERFCIEYFGFLRQETRRLKTTIPFKVGEMVLIGQESLKRLHWPLARIIQLYLGKDGLGRVAKVKTSSSDKIRPIQKLYNLEITPEIRYRDPLTERSPTQEVRLTTEEDPLISQQ
ncbi:hypothetical protein LAZ67_14001828, partial [Cordylochernes scorpioides]